MTRTRAQEAGELEEDSEAIHAGGTPDGLQPSPGGLASRGALLSAGGRPAIPRGRISAAHFQTEPVADDGGAVGGCGGGGEGASIGKELSVASPSSAAAGGSLAPISSLLRCLKGARARQGSAAEADESVSVGLVGAAAVEGEWSNVRGCKRERERRRKGERATPRMLAPVQDRRAM